LLPIADFEILDHSLPQREQFHEGMQQGDRNMKIRSIPWAAALVVFALASACSPDPGSDAWCKDMKEKPKGEWTAEQASMFAKSCVLK